ncbi:PucR family transcriptional regulator [Brevibacillus fluminis]|uniref:PucR family transcriptional regulator n=1 Tax=Brevibacillus fluminis TaxID=511487 RepID=UPI003F88E6E2
MTITIREALQLPDMVHTRLVAGQQGMSNQIRWVTIVELLEDTSRLQEGEFLITTGFGLASDSKRIEQFIPSLAERKLSGVAIHTGFYLREIPPVFLAEADRYGLPLIEIPSGINFSTVTKAILQPIINRQFETLAYSQAIHEQMLDVAFSKGGLPAIASELANLTKGSVRLVDSFGYEVVSVSSPQCDPLCTEPHATHMLPVGSTRESFGTLSLSKPKTEWQELDHVALKHAATLCTFEYVKERAVAATEWRLMGDFAEELLSGQAMDQAELDTRSRKLGYPLNGSHLIAAFSILQERKEVDRASLYVQLRSLIKRLADQYGCVYLLRERSQYLLMIIPEREKSDALLKRIAIEWQRLYPATQIQLGVADAKEQVSQFREAADEAVFTLLAYPLLAQSPDPLHYSRMNGYQFLFPYYRDPVALNKLWQPLLARLIAYDTKHGQQLAETLEKYLQHNLNGIKAAQTLFIHRHTLKYRLQQIAEKTGLDLDDATHRWQLQLALMAYKLASLLYPASV